MFHETRPHHADADLALFRAEHAERLERIRRARHGRVPRSDRARRPVRSWFRRVQRRSVAAAPSLGSAEPARVRWSHGPQP